MVPPRAHPLPRDGSADERSREGGLPRSGQGPEGQGGPGEGEREGGPAAQARRGSCLGWIVGVPHSGDEPLGDTPRRNRTGGRVLVGAGRAQISGSSWNFGADSRSGSWRSHHSRAAVGTRRSASRAECLWKPPKRLRDLAAFICHGVSVDRFRRSARSARPCRKGSPRSDRR